MALQSASAPRAAHGTRTTRAIHRYEFSQIHMGLPVRLVLYASDRQTVEAAARAAFDRIAELDRVMSDYRPDSDLRQLEERVGEYVTVHPDLFLVLVRAVAIAAETEGAFDPTVGPLVALWRKSRRTGVLPDARRLAVAQSNVGWRRVALNERRQAVRLSRGARLDLGGIAKGYILQEALRTLRSRTITRALVESGGDIVVGDAPPGGPGWRIYAPGAGPEFTARASRLVNAALATSGGAIQFVEVGGIRYSHVIDPRTGVGVTSPALARVIAADGATADALATALTILGPSGLPRILDAFPEVLADVVR